LGVGQLETTALKFVALIAKGTNDVMRVYKSDQTGLDSAHFMGITAQFLIYPSWTLQKCHILLESIGLLKLMRSLKHRITSRYVLTH
jgi:hypothetical protein